MHAGKLLKTWMKTQGISAARLAQQLPEPLTDGQMIYQYHKCAYWKGSTANGLWLVEEGAFPIEALTTPRTARKSNGRHAA